VKEIEFKSKEDFKKPHAWDLGKRFRRVCKLAGIKDLKIHDLRHFATTVLFMDEIPDALVREPDKSDAEGFMHSNVVLNEDADSTLSGIFRSCRDMEEAI
jgi:hypothetical protein